MLTQIKSTLRKTANPEKAKTLQRFFKTGVGEYGEGDIFLGVTVPQTREIVKEFWRETPLAEVQELLNSGIHEERLTGLLILVAKYQKSDEEHRKLIYNFYLQNTRNVNNWDLVDLTAPNIVGNFLLDKNRKILYKLAKSKNLWERRIAVVSCFAFIRNNDFKDTLKLSEILLGDKEDLIHKAAGWMLREIGKRDVSVLKNFLEQHCKNMPRTMLRYSIEKFDEEKRKYFLKK